MVRSRTEKILEDWQMVARSARRPAEAPRPGIGRITLAVGIVGTAAAVIILIVALSARGLSPLPQPSLPVVGTSPSPSTPVGPSLSASVAVTTPPSAVPSATGPTGPTGPTGTPAAADLSAARTAIDQYTAALVQGDYAAAWALLGPEDQAHIGTFAAWSAERRAFFQSVGGRYTIVVSPSSVAPITDWLAGTHGASIDLAHAVLIEVDYPALAGNNAGYELFIVNSTADGPRIYSVR